MLFEYLLFPQRKSESSQITSLDSLGKYQKIANEILIVFQEQGRDVLCYLENNIRKKEKVKEKEQIIDIRNNNN